MIAFTGSLICVFNVLANFFKWCFIFISVMIMYFNGFDCTLEDWFLLLSIAFAFLVTICDLFAIMCVSIPKLFMYYANRARNSNNE